MAWFFPAILSAVSLATADAVTKRYFSDASAYEMGLVRLLSALPWILLSLFFIPWVRPDGVFFLCILIALPMEATAFFCYMKALKASPLSLTLPFLAFTPGFVIVTGWLVLGEKITAGGFLGIVMIVTGSYVLNLSKVTSGFLGPFRAIVREPGSKLMLLVSFIYAFTSVIGKLAVLHSNPYVFGSLYNITLTALMVALIPFSRAADPVKEITKKPFAGLMLGAAVSISVFSHFIAISMVQAAYMISIKRMSLLFGVLYGAWLFREERIMERLTGAVLMLIGAFLIGLYS
ncbi:MAG TPA: DMT family transporter [Syntrophales bacterium]|jgi:drug/metabolite transporter (DMT)-like permease|nr:DMT family transporter [Syntrophales bacterium]